ncbi:rhomboid family intramembrane serine protease [Mucilaginibacter ginsenosidivorans]|uniref:Rhomboid family intramembrane serine protease n=1 Tax=Mucilaginibacter ginsenosidivorans TaxID=398053 RepID=A0A5B8UT24_9SPHI|nr:rhomboid family intramembrane serine protease [Mucilaginibacter ginsenosidivorans]QEC62260.1 rhomboid family intramembrane serine protease [Mucilaginibacter ginsenosidivorans]
MSQYRQSPFANLTPVVKNLLIINIIFAIAPYLVGKIFDMNTSLAAFYFDSPFFRPWQIVTYMFMHAPLLKEPSHLLFNMFGLFMFGPILEYSMGSKRFFNFYFICGIGAIVMQMLIQAIEVHSIMGSFVMPHPITDQSFYQYGGDIKGINKLAEIYYAPTVGASGALFGILVAFGLLYPNMELMIIFIPIPIKAKYLVSFYVLYEIYDSVVQRPGDHVAHLVHLGGGLLGLIMIKIWRMRRMDNFF